MADDGYTYDGQQSLPTLLSSHEPSAQVSYKQEGHKALNRTPEYTGQNQTFNFEIWVIFDHDQSMTLTFDTHSTSLTHLAECVKQLWDQRLQ